MNFKMRYTQVLGFLSILFLIFICVQANYNQFAADDFYFLKAQKNIGTIPTVLQSYFTFSGRWASYSLTSGLLNLSSQPYFLFIFSITTYILLTFVTYQFLGEILQLNKIEVSVITKINLSICLTAACFFCHSEPGEIWFWYTSVCSYLLSLIALIGLLALLLANKKSTIRFILLLITALFIGGASESFAICSIYILIMLLLVSNKLKLRLAKNYAIIAIAALLFSFTLEIVAPGNWIRLYMLPPQGSIQQTISPFKSWIKISLLTSSRVIWPGILFLLPFFVLGSSMNEKLIQNKTLQLLKEPYFIALLVLSSFLILLPASFILSETPPTRALSQFHFLVIFTTAMYMLLLGMHTHISPKSLFFLKASMLSLAIGFLSIVIIKQGIKSRDYARSYQKRMQVLESASIDNNKSIQLDSLSKCNYLYSAEITKDSSHFLNKQLQNYFQLKNGISVK